MIKWQQGVHADGPARGWWDQQIMFNNIHVPAVINSKTDESAGVADWPTNLFVSDRQAYALYLRTGLPKRCFGVVFCADFISSSGKLVEGRISRGLPALDSKCFTNILTGFYVVVDAIIAVIPYFLVILHRFSSSNSISNQKFRGKVQT